MPEGLRLESDMKEEIEGTLVSEELIPPTPYRRLVGKIRQTIHTRPNIMFTAGVVSKYLQAPQRSHMKAAEHIMRYLKGTSQWGILYRQGEKIELGDCKLRYTKHLQKKKVQIVQKKYKKMLTTLIIKD
jgi:hypothetical protein